MKIHQKMAAILKEFPAVTKDRLQPQAKYNYRGIDDALRELNPLLGKHGVYIQLTDLMPDFQDAGQTRSGNTQVRCILTGNVRFVCGEDGSYTECSLFGEGIDTGDKAGMKAQANGLKYVLWYTFCVPTDEKKDSEAFDDPDSATPAAPKRAKKATKKAQAKSEGSLADQLIASIKACSDKEALEALGASELRPWAGKQPQGDADKKRVVDAYVERQSALS